MSKRSLGKYLNFFLSFRNNFFINLLIPSCISNVPSSFGIPQNGNVIS